MKKTLLFIFFICFFTACNSISPNILSKEQKDELIQQANNNNIQAMLDLNKYYNFPQTKEGLYYYEKWFKQINNKNDAKNIYKIAQIYSEYYDMFINGKDKVISLYSLSSSLSFKKADIKKIDFLLKIYERKEASFLNKKIINTLNEEESKELYKVYEKRYSKNLLKELTIYMKNNNFDFPVENVIARLKPFIYKKNDNDSLLSTINEIISNKNKKEILLMAEYLQKRYKYLSAIHSYNSYLELEKNNHLIYYNLGVIYKKGNYREKLKKDLKRSRLYFEKAEKLGSKKAKLALLKSYSVKKEDINKYFNLKTKLEKNNDGKIILSEYFRNKGLKNKSNTILEELANKGVKEAILQLSLIKPSKYKFDPEEYQITLKWQEYIINSKNKELEDKFRTELMKYKYVKYFEKSKSHYIKQDLEDLNIIRLRDLYRNNKYNKKKNALKYLIKAANANDAKSIMDLANLYSFSKKYLDFNKMVKTITPLIEQGDKKALRFLANRYFKPAKGFEKYKDINKALFYYEKLAKLGDEASIRKLADLYICKSCYDGKVINYKKALFYLKKLDKKKYPRYYASIGWMYNFGKGVEIDLLKAKEYYEYSAKNNYGHAYYYLAWLYYKDTESNVSIIETNYKKALVYLKQGAKLKDADCINLLGLFYQKAYGVEKDIEQAVVYYKRIASFHKYASFHLAEYYYKNQKDYKKAVKYYKISAKRKSSAAYVLLGIIYEKGLLGKIDAISALKYYKKAYKINKDEIAAYNIALIHHYGKGGITINYSNARKWYRLSNTKDANKKLLKLNKDLTKK